MINYEHLKEYENIYETCMIASENIVANSKTRIIAGMSMQRKTRVI